jgi:dihydrolipoamide dehydrogenase
VHGQALAHVASAEGIVCVEKIAGKNPKTINYKNIPCCTYTMPEIASIGLTEKKAQEAGYEIRTGKFPFTASGKANSSGERQGFVKLIFNADNDKLLGAHMIGANVTEMISELVLAKELNITGPDIIKSVFPHPTMSEAIKEAAANAYNEAIHI